MSVCVCVCLCLLSGHANLYIRTPPPPSSSAIDEFQEHVLHKGDQSNESALEQLKDEQIAAAIRSQLHLKENKDGE